MFAHIFKEIEVLRTKQLPEELFGVGKGMSQAFFDGCELTIAWELFCFKIIISMDWLKDV